MSEAIKRTLGYHRDMAAAIFGDDSEATKYLDRKIEVQGRDEPVLAEESQVVNLLMTLHMKGLRKQKHDNTLAKDADKHNGN